jgi:hypothetical protein
MALCEVIGTPVDKSGTGIYVVPEEQRISARYFMIYTTTQPIPSIYAKTLMEHNKPM